MKTLFVLTLILLLLKVHPALVGWIAACLLGFILITVVLSTVMDTFEKRKKNTPDS